MRNFARLSLAMAVAVLFSGLAQAQCGGPFGRCASRQAAVVSVPQGVPVQATVVQHHVFHQPTVAQAYIPASTDCGCSCSQAAPVSVTMHQPATPVRTVAHAGAHYAGNVAQAVVQPMGAFMSSDQSLAQRKANQQAAEGRMRHVGGSLGSGGYEGVGFSTRSAEDAIRNCCYWGKRTPTAVAVQRGPNGWYANVLYR